MNRIISITILFTALFFDTVPARPIKFSCRRAIEQNGNLWQKIELPDNIYSRCNQNLTDLRIFGFSENDTIEAPYIIDYDSDQNISENISFKLLNKSFNEKGRYYTFDLSGNKIINSIELHFKEENFDWLADLQGSMNLKEWFNIAENKRLVSIKNDYTDYKYTTLRFENSSYRYFRLLIKSETDPRFTGANISELKTIPGNYRQIPVTTSFSSNRNSGNTTINISLEQPEPVSSVQFFFSDNFDYYRPVYIEYLSDSTKTEKGWSYYYRPLLNGYVTSLENNEFVFSDIITSKIRAIILNKNNEPLNFRSVAVKGKKYSLTARITKPAEYFLYYGYKYAQKPDYDIAKFKDKIPAELSAVKLGKEEILLAGAPKPEESKLWLWIIIGIVMATLGSFTLRMIRKENTYAGN